MRSTAEISDCGKYRYLLTRDWGEAAVKALPIIMLNPSTADGSTDDPTIRRCVGFAKREGYNGIMVGNLWALRATNPKELATAEDPYGPDNSKWLEDILRYATGIKAPVLCAWGASDYISAYSIHRIVGRMLKEYGVQAKCLGTTASGAPRHPLYVHGETPLYDFSLPTL